MVKNVKKIMGALCGAIFCTVVAVGVPQMASAAEEIAIDETNFPDEIFRDYVKAFDKDNSNGLSEGEIADVKSISVSNKSITSLKGIEHFTALTDLFCSNNQLTSLSVSNNTALTYLSCSYNQLTSLDVNGATTLTKLSCDKNKLTSLDVSNNTALTDLSCKSNQLTSLDVNGATALKELHCNFNKLTNLDVSNNTALTELDCYPNQLTSLDVSNNTALTKLYCSSNQLTSLDVNGATALTYLSCDNNQLTSLDVSNNTALTDLYCSSNQLTSLDVNGATALKKLHCFINKLVSLNVSNNTALTDLLCDNNQLTSLDVSNNTALTYLECSNNKLTSLDVSNNTALTSLSCCPNQLTSLDVSNNTELTSLLCSYNQLTSLDVSNNTALTSLNCENNQLTSLDVSNNTALASLYCFSNHLTSLDVNGATALTRLECSYNQLTSLNVSNNTALTDLYCSYNQLTELKLNSQTYDKLSLYKGRLHGNVNLSNLENITETTTNDSYNVSLLKIIDITKPATYKVNGKDFTIIYTDTVIMPSAAPSTEPSATPSNVHIFSDYDYNNPVTGPAIIYGNGISKTIDGKKVNNKVFTAYTDILASYKYTLNNNGTVKPSVGKVIVGITKSTSKPTISNKNKIIDTSASKIAKAKIKNGQITVTAVGKEGGLVYLWVIDTGNKNVSAYYPIDVKLAPTKLEVQDKAGSKLAKNTELQNGKTLDVCVAGLVGSTKTKDGIYKATVNSKYNSYITVTPVEGSTDQFTIKAIGLKNNKKTKVTVTFTCDQNNKKTNFSLTLIE